MDIDLPGISGLEIARRLQGEQAREIAVFLIGDKTSEEHADAARFALLRKGSSPAVLVAAVLAQLRR